MESLTHLERIHWQKLNAASGIALSLPLQEISRNGSFIKLEEIEMELLLIASNGSILALLYQKLLDNERLLVDLRNRISALEAIAVERRKRGGRELTLLERDDNVER